LQVDDLTGEVGLGLGPKDRVEAERFDVYALLIHRLDCVPVKSRATAVAPLTHQPVPF
jgi:hypothetical protein